MVDITTSDVFREITPAELADRAADQIADIWEEITRTVMLIRAGRAHWSDVTSLLKQIDLVQAELRMAGLTVGLLSPWMGDAVSMASASVTLLIASPGSIPRDADGIRRLLGTLPESDRQELMQWMSTRRGFDVAQWQSISAVTRYSPATAAYKFPRIEEGVKFLAARNVVTVDQWQKLAAREKVRTVYLPGANTTVVNKLRTALSESFRDGESLTDFRKRIVGVTDASKFQVETLFRTQTKQAYLDGVTTILDNPRVGARFPAVLYQATRDNRTRPLHADWDGRIIGVDSPEYATAKALQAEYNCRCTLIPLTERRAREMGWTGGTSAVKAKPAARPMAPKKPVEKYDIDSVTDTPKKARQAAKERFGIELSRSPGVGAVEAERHYIGVTRSLHAMSEATGISPSKLSLRGKLTVRVVEDSETKMKGASAFYRPSAREIGVTTSAGSGAFGHEWLHALDNSAVIGGYASESAGNLVTTQKNRQLAEAIRAAVVAIKDSGYTARVSMYCDKYKSLDRQYWEQGCEVFARCGESILSRIDKSGEKYLSKSSTENGPLWPTEEEMDKIEAAYRAVFRAYEEQAD